MFAFHTQSTPKYHYLKDIKRDTLVMPALLEGLKAEHSKWIAFGDKVPESVFRHLSQGVSV